MKRSIHFLMFTIFSFHIYGQTKNCDCRTVSGEVMKCSKRDYSLVNEMPIYSEKQLEFYKDSIKSNRVCLCWIEAFIDDEIKSVQSSIIGIWTDDKSNFAILKSKGYYKAYILDSTIDSIQHGELKAEFLLNETGNGFHGIYYSYNYTPMHIEGDVCKEGTLLVLTRGLIWRRLKDAQIIDYMSE